MQEVDADEPRSSVVCLLIRTYNPTGFGPCGFDSHPRHHLVPIARNESPEVELHRDLIPDHAPFRIDIDALWGRASSTDLGDFTLPHPTPDDVILHVCVHTAFNHEFMLGLRGACDVDAMVARFGSRIDWDRLVETANAEARSGYVYAAWRLTQELLQTPIPDQVLRSLLREPEDELIAAEAVAFVLSTADPIPATMGAVREAGTVASKLGAHWRDIFPSADDLRRIYSIDPGSPRVALYYAARPFDLLLRRGGQVLALVAGSPRAAPVAEKDHRRRRIRKWARHERE